MKKAQVTAFILIGIFILAVVVGLILLSQSVREREVSDSLESTREIPSDLEPVVNYIESCIDEVSKDGIFLLGKQAGTIYRSQGGRSVDIPDEAEGTMFINYEGYKVLYLISLPISGGFRCNPSLPEYPINDYWAPYPYQWNSLGKLDLSLPKVYKQDDCFGKKVGVSIDSMKSTLEYYIKSNVQTKCDFSSFTNIEAEKGEPEVKVTPFLAETIIEINYPIILTNKVTGSKAEINDFKRKIRFGFARLVEFINNRIQDDVDDPTFDMRQSTNEFKVSVISDAFNKDDIITVRSDSTVLDGQPFVFVFARKNRYPILEYLYNISFDDISFMKDEVITWEEVVLQNITGVDPDEDGVNVTVTIGTDKLTPVLLESGKPYTITRTDVEDIGHLAIRVEANDMQYSDYVDYRLE